MNKLSTMPTKIFFRVDASVSIGYGHFFRTLVLVEEFRKNKVECVFIVRKLDENFEELLLKREINYHLIPSTTPLSSEKDTGWSNDLQMDLDETLRIASGQVLICDNYAFGEIYYTKIRPNLLLLCAFDDYAEKVFPVDILINQNFKAEEDYSILENIHNTKILAGISFVLIRNKYTDIKITKAENKIPRDYNFKTISICFGATDSERLTEKILDYIKIDIQKVTESNISINAILGPGFLGKTEFKSKFSSLKFLNILENPENIEEVFFNSDLAIVGAGGLVWELAYLQKPMAIFQTAENQNKLIQALLNSDRFLVLSDLDKWTLQLRNFIFDGNIQFNQKSSLDGLVDGMGKNRVCDEIIESVLNKVKSNSGSMNS